MAVTGGHPRPPGSACSSSSGHSGVGAGLLDRGEGGLLLPPGNTPPLPPLSPATAAHGQTPRLLPPASPVNNGPMALAAARGSQPMLGQVTPASATATATAADSALLPVPALPALRTSPKPKPSCLQGQVGCARKPRVDQDRAAAVAGKPPSGCSDESSPLPGGGRGRRRSKARAMPFGLGHHLQQQQQPRSPASNSHKYVRRLAQTYLLQRGGGEREHALEASQQGEWNVWGRVECVRVGEGGWNV